MQALRRKCSSLDKVVKENFIYEKEAMSMTRELIESILNDIGLEPIEKAPQEPVNPEN